jgi:D-alanine-D-alanine ligase
MGVKKLRVGVLMGGQSAEREISLKTGRAICQALVRRGHKVFSIDVDASLPQQLSRKQVDVAFLALHGPGGEDGTVQGVLEVLGIPYTGSGVRASAIAMDKAMTKAILQVNDIPVPQGVVLQRSESRKSWPARLKFPQVVKPSTEGSTIGVSIVRKRAELQPALRRAYQFGDRVVVESYIDGREVALGVLDGEALPAVEIISPGGFYDFEAKYQKAETQYLCPAPLPRNTLKQVRNLAVRAYTVIGCAGAARVDFRISRQGRPAILEINTIPGMTERSLLPMAAAQAGMTYDTLVERMLGSALGRMPAKRLGRVPSVKRKLA